ncbi:MAG: M56 family metallopeptidase [Chitinophagaceae bacterium]|nr:M56 family metallopeptidase [Chitinophagaceae bacterium]
MAQFAYIFSISMLHSLWQSALLLAFYFLFTKLFSQTSPLTKRNFLFASLLIQILLFFAGFCFHFFSFGANVQLPELFNSITPYLPAKQSLLSTTFLLFVTYCVFVTLKCVHSIYTWYLFKQQLKTTLQKPLVQLKLFTTLHAHHLGIKRTVSLWFSQRVTTPITFGFLKPIILLPVSLANNISTQQAETLILHELAHIKANDYLLNFVLIGLETIFFFNPFVLTLCKKIRLQRELHCDGMVIQYNYSPILYAETLLQAAQFKLSPVFSLAATSNKKQLLKRIQYFTNKQNYTTKKYQSALLPLFILVYVAIFLVSMFSIAPVNSKFTTLQETIFIPSVNTELALPFTTQAKPVTKTKQTTKQKISTAKAKLTTPYTTLFDVVLTPQDMVENVFPVAQIETDNIKQIIIREEQSGSKKSSISVYNLIYKNGKWVIQPQWMASKHNIDSAATNYDSSELYPLMENEQ